MTPVLRNIEYVGACTLRLFFADGKVGGSDLEPQLWGEVFEPLRNLDLFRQFHLDAELNTVVWPTGAGLSPAFLYDNAA